MKLINTVITILVCIFMVTMLIYIGDKIINGCDGTIVRGLCWFHCIKD